MSALARNTDPITSRLAAQSLGKGRKDMIRAIRRYVRMYPSSTAFEIAAGVERDYPGRWDEGTLRSAVSRSGLEVSEIHALSPRGRICQTYYLPQIDTEAL